MKSRWRDVRLVAQAVVITSAVWLVLFYLFGDRLPTAPSPAELAGGGPVAGPGGEGTQIDPVAEPRGTQSRGKRVAMTPQNGLPDQGKLFIPVAGVRKSDVVDSYNDDRGGGTRTHEAIDILADTGTPVLAAAPGTVEKLFWSDLGGNTIYIRSPDKRKIYYYAHLDAYRNGLKEGQSVRAGEPLGSVGSSGNADPAAPHLHFSVLNTTPEANWSEGTPINPYPLLSR
ncbi:MAG: hypothetical protein CMN74_01825 [Sphingorhabdus sp.]|nr:hypothetical protein [Sphingorhabdus sp.]